MTDAQKKADGFTILETQVADLKNRLAANRNELETYRAFLMEIEDRLQPEEQRLKTYETLKQKLTMLRPQIEGRYHEIKRSQATIQSLKEKIENASEAEKVFLENKRFIHLEEELEVEKARTEHAIQQKENLEELLKRDTAELQEAVNQRRRLEKQLENQLAKLQSEQEELTEEYSPETHRKVEDDVKRLREDHAKTCEATGRLKRSIQEDESGVKQAENQLMEKREAWRQAEDLKKENTVLDVLRRSLREVVQPVTRKNNVLRMSDAFQSFYQELSNDNIDYASLDEEGNVEIIRNGEPSPVNSLSGGETTCASIALRLSICSSLTKNQLLLLDEPTIHLDELYRAKLREFLSSHNFEQLIVVTHDNTFDSLPAQIFSVEKKLGESIVQPITGSGGI